MLLPSDTISESSRRPEEAFTHISFHWRLSSRAFLSQQIYFALWPKSLELFSFFVRKVMCQFWSCEVQFQFETWRERHSSFEIRYCSGIARTCESTKVHSIHKQVKFRFPISWMMYKESTKKVKPKLIFDALIRS